VTPADLADRIARARNVALSGAVTDPYVIALAELSALAEERLLAQYELEDCTTDRELLGARSRLHRVDRALHTVLRLPAGLALRPTGALMPYRRVRAEPSRLWAAISSAWHWMGRAWRR